MYLVWKADFENEKVYTRAVIENPKSLAGKKLTSGLPLAGQLPELRMELTKKYPPADYFHAGPIFIVSERMRVLLESKQANIEFHSITLLRAGQEINAGRYFFANLLEKVDCIDRDKSEYKLDADFIDKIEKLVIDDTKANSKPLIRLAKTYDVITLASQELADAVVASGMTGIKFISPQDWRW
jgi:hypothetical protein